MGTKGDIGEVRSIAINKPYASIREMVQLVGERLHTRYESQTIASVHQFSFTMGSDV